MASATDNLFTTRLTPKFIEYFITLLDKARPYCFFIDCSTQNKFRNIYHYTCQDFSFKECVTEKKFSYLSTKIYVVVTQKDRLNETVLLSTQNICWKFCVRKYLQFYAECFCLSKPVHVHLKMLITNTAFEDTNPEWEAWSGSTLFSINPFKLNGHAYLYQ